MGAYGEVLEAAGLVAVVAGLFLLFGPWALVASGSVMVVVVEVLDRGGEEDRGPRGRAREGPRTGKRG